MSEPTWRRFAEGLAAELPWLDLGTLVVIEPDVPGRGLAQFLLDEGGYRVEALSNEFLAEPYRLTPEREEILADAGWIRPDPDKSGDLWWWSAAWPATSAVCLQLAEMIVVALRDAFGFTGPAELRYRSWNERAGNAPVELPRLGIPRRALDS